MKFVALAFFLSTHYFVSSLAAAGREPEPDEDGIYDLDTENFNKFITDNPLVMVQFYSRTCGFCKAFKPEYAKLAKQIKDDESPMKVAGVDGTFEVVLKEKYKIKGYPTLKFFREGKPIDFTGERDKAEAIYAWMKKKSGEIVKFLDKVEDAKKFQNSADVTVIGFFADKDSSGMTAFTEAAVSIGDIEFAVTPDKEIFKAFDMPHDGILLFKKFDEHRTEYTDDLVADNIVSWIRKQSLRLVTEFDAKSGVKLLGNDIRYMIYLFGSKKSDAFSQMLEEFKKAAKEYRGTVLFIYVNTDNEVSPILLDFYDLKLEELPDLRLVNLQQGLLNITKHKPDFPSTEYTAENIIKFTQDCLEGKAKMLLKSQQIPPNWDKGPVKVLVGKTFEQVAMDPEKDVLVAMVAPEALCQTCNKIPPVLDELGDKYKDSSKVVIAALDAAANELAHIKPKTFPQIILVLSGSNNVMEFTGQPTTEELSKFIDSHGKKKGKPFDMPPTSPRKTEL